MQIEHKWKHRVNTDDIDMILNPHNIGKMTI